VLAAESEKEMHEWMQAVRTSRMCVSDPAAAGMVEDARRASADSELDSARDKRSDPEAELSRIEEELEAVQAEHRQLEAEKESAEKQLKELMVRAANQTLLRVPDVSRHKASQFAGTFQASQSAATLAPPEAHTFFSVACHNGVSRTH